VKGGYREEISEPQNCKTITTLSLSLSLSLFLFYLRYLPQKLAKKRRTKQFPVPFIVVQRNQYILENSLTDIERYHD
jgi:hypothetical protein